MADTSTKYIQLKSALGTNVYPVLTGTRASGSVVNRPLRIGTYGQIEEIPENSGEGSGINTPIYLNSSGVLKVGSSTIYSIQLQGGAGITVSSTDAEKGPVYSNTISLASVSGVNGTYGSGGASPDAGGAATTTVKVPKITVDSYGRVTSVTAETVTLKNTYVNDAVKQTSFTTSTSALPLIFATAVSPSTNPAGVGYDTNITYTPSDQTLTLGTISAKGSITATSVSVGAGTITAGTFSGKATTAGTADKVGHKLTVKGNNANGIEFDGSGDKTINITGSNDISVSASISGDVSTITVSGAALSSRIDGIMSANQAMRFRKVLTSSTANTALTIANIATNNKVGDETAAQELKAGDTFIVGENIATVDGKAVEQGDMVLMTSTNTVYIIQANIDGAVTASGELGTNKVMLGNGNRTAQVSSRLKDGNVVTNNDTDLTASFITYASGTNTIANSTKINISSVAYSDAALGTEYLLVGKGTNAKIGTSGVKANDVITKAGSLANEYLVVGSGEKTVNNSKLKLSSVVRIGTSELSTNYITYAISTNTIASSTNITLSSVVAAVNAAAHDAKVKQTITDTENSTYNILFQSTALGTQTTTDETRFSQRLKFNPNTCTLELGTTGTSTSGILVHNGDIKVQNGTAAAMSAVFFTEI